MEYGKFPKNASKKDRMLLNASKKDRILLNASKKDRMLLKSLAKRFFIFNGVLYKKDKVLHLRCVSEKETE